MADKRLLIVDDEPAFGLLVTAAARKLGYEVVATTEAAGFKSAYRTFDPTVVMLDIVMPDEDGVELIGWLAGQGCKAKVIVVSGVDARYAHWAGTLGSANGLPEITALTKPVELKDLRDALP